MDQGYNRLPLHRYAYQTKRGETMSLEDKSFDRIDETDLQALCTGQEREGKILEFKESQPGNSDGDKKEFLADATSFANTSGGHLIFGIKETGGVATEICGISIDDPDAEVLRMENLLRSGVQRRLSRYAIKPLHLRNEKAAIIIRIPRSWALPHRVILGGMTSFTHGIRLGNTHSMYQNCRPVFYCQRRLSSVSAAFALTGLLVSMEVRHRYRCHEALRRFCM